MEVTKDNFDELLPSILASISECTFLSIDAELTGLHLTDCKENYFDSVSERYRILRQNASHFLLIQFGMVLFFYDPATDTFTHKSYNFYLFPSQIANSSPNVRFTCEASSLEFLASWGFDFNKLIYKGIPYLTLSCEQKMKDNYDKKQLYLQSEENQQPCPVPENLRPWMEDMMGKVRRLQESGGDKGEELLLEELSPFQRKLIFNNVKPKYSGKLYFETIVRTEGGGGGDEEKMDAGGGGIGSGSDGEGMMVRKPVTPEQGGRQVRVLRICKMSEEEKREREEEKKRVIWGTIDKGVGFSKVIRQISETGKIVVGHNMILDVAHSVQQFVGDLPEDLEGFKALVQTAFPNLVDTKLMCCTHPFREHFSSSVLGDVLKRVQEKPFGLPEIRKKEDGLSYSLEDKKMHEAGYDAFITGVCFIGLCQYLGKLQVPVKKRVLPESPLVMPFLNKLYLMRMLDISYLNISGTDLTPSRDHVFHVTCPKEATTKNIVSLFQPFGQVQVWWQDDNNLFVSLNDKDQAALVMKNIEIEKGSHIRVVPFTQYQSSRVGGKRPLGMETASSTAGGSGGGGGKHHKKKGGSKKGGKGKGGGKGNRQHNSCSTSSSSSGGGGDGEGGGGDTPPGASDGGDEGSPTFSGSDSVHHQKKKRPKTENGGGGGEKKGAGAKGGSGGGGPRFEEPSNWD